MHWSRFLREKKNVEVAFIKNSFFAAAKAQWIHNVSIVNGVENEKIPMKMVKLMKIVGWNWNFFKGLYISFLVGKAIVVVIIKKQMNEKPSKRFKIDYILEIVGTKAN